ncbi:hypothetical protein SynBIOSU31_01329 [Synechococcus sp. BIOS-U3-1]|nr:hypothetical protein SynBIOSU31_01329 [Synechococcus sp. BIOS-U3-1]
MFLQELVLSVLYLSFGRTQLAAASGGHIRVYKQATECLWRIKFLFRDLRESAEG